MSFDAALNCMARAERVAPAPSTLLPALGGLDLS